jgi:hypothetical protein
MSMMTPTLNNTVDGNRRNSVALIGAAVTALPALDSDDTTDDAAVARIGTGIDVFQNIAAAFERAARKIPRLVLGRLRVLSAVRSDDTLQSVKVQDGYTVIPNHSSTAGVTFAGVALSSGVWWYSVTMTAPSVPVQPSDHDDVIWIGWLDVVGEAQAQAGDIARGTFHALQTYTLAFCIRYCASSHDSCFRLFHSRDAFCCI